MGNGRDGLFEYLFQLSPVPKVSPRLWVAGTLHLAQTGPRVTQVPAAKWEWCKELSDDHNTDREYDLLWGLFVSFLERPDGDIMLPLTTYFSLFGKLVCVWSILGIAK